MLELLALFAVAAVIATVLIKVINYFNNN